MYGGQQQTDSKAIGSLILGILSVTILWIFAGIPAVILGHMSRSQIQKSMGRLKGEGMALAGLIMGYISVAAFPVILIIAAIAIPNLLRARMSANESAAASTVRTLISNEIEYSVKYQANGYTQDLATLGPGPTGTCAGEGTAEHACLIDDVLGNARCTAGTWCTRSAFRYIIIGEGSMPATDFVITATPVDENAAMKSYCATADGVLRSRFGMVASPPTVSECKHWTAL